ncbi:hypothetical protein SNE40_009384 [Patella caerulea]|uniref:Secreted protein n=1 Tax=Patella caerulea TaxID=87958 RepID=A0AAN8JYY5_PATCE
MPTRFAIFALCLAGVVLFEEVSSRYIECPDGCYVSVDSHCVCPLGGSYEKRGVRLPFRYGKRNSKLPTKNPFREGILNHINPYRLYDLEEEK